MEQLRYRPSRFARALVTSRSGTIGVLAASSTEYGPASSLAAIEDAARERGYYVNTANVRGNDPESIAGAIEHLMNQAIEGLVVIAPQMRVFDVLSAMAIRVPTVSLQSTGRRDAHDLGVDQVEGARLATQHLIDLGHKEIVHLAGPQDWIEAESRMRGFLRAVDDADLRTHPPILGDWTADFGYYAATELARYRDFTAVFASNDLMALGLLHGFRDAGLDVPRDVSVVGFDDLPISRHSWPPLTTIHQDFEEVGHRVVAALLDGVAPDAGAPSNLIIPELIVRESTAPPSL